MKNEEIYELLKKINAEISNLEDIKRMLLAEKKKNDDENRQNVFKKYLNTPNTYGKEPILFYNLENVMFTNGISVYMVKSEFLKTNGYDFSPVNKEKKFKLVKANEINKYITEVEKLYGKLESSCYLWKSNGKIIAGDDDYLLQEGHYNEEEINMCDKILNNPIYRSSIENPVLKAESEIGKAYILGYKRCQK